jgi:N-acetylneuraminate synthase
MNRADGGPDADFSCEPEEMTQLITEVNTAWTAMGTIRFGPSDRELSSKAFRRSLRASQALPKGTVLSASNIRSMRPAGGLPPHNITDLVGRKINQDLEIGAAITSDVLE